MTATIILGFDLGTRTGYAALRDNGTRIMSGTWDFSHRGAGDRAERPGARWRRVAATFTAFLEHWAKRGRVIAGYELVRGHGNGGAQAAHIYGGMEAMLLAAMDTLGIVPLRVTVQDVKRAATGVGGGKRAGKAQVLAAAQERWPGVQGEDEADAVFVAEVLMARAVVTR